MAEVIRRPYRRGGGAPQPGHELDRPGPAGPRLRDEESTINRIRSIIEEWRPSTVTGGEPFFPLFVLFGLNAVDELDRTAFAVLLPEIRDHFDLGNAAALGLVAASTVAVLVLEIPLSFYVDRGRRVRIAAVGAAVWGLFSAATGLATSLLLLVVARVGAGGGRSVVNPTHGSLLSDYYAPPTRVKVFGVHRIANSMGQFVGPAVAGGLAYLFGWRVPFLLFVVPTAVFVVLALRLREPVRGLHERRAAGADEVVAATEESPERAWATVRTLSRVRTLRRVWMSIPFLAIALFGVPNLLSLIYEDVFDLNAAQRGFIAAGAEPMQIVGLLLGLPLAHRLVARDPAFLLRFVAVVGVVDGTLLGVLAFAPNVAVAVGIHMLVAFTISMLAPVFFAMLSLVAPPRARAVAFSILAVFAVPGIAVFLPVIGAVSDAVGLQASMLVMVPISFAAGLILSSASSFIAADIEAVRTESRTRVEQGA